MNRIGGDFCEDDFGRDGHGHASKTKEKDGKSII